MAIDKSNTPMWMRVVIILVALSFLGMLVPVVLGGLGKTGGSSGSTTKPDSIASVYQPRVDAAMSLMQNNPTNPDIVAQVGHSYYEWAVALYESGQVQASIPLWLGAVNYYDQALALRPDDDVVLGNKAFALFYAKSGDAPAALEAFIAAASDNAALAPQVESARQMLAELGGSTATGTP